MADKHDVTIIRPFNVIGRGQNADFLLPKLVRHFVDRAPAIRLGNLDPVRDYVDVAKCCEVVIRLMSHKGSYGQTINLCSGRGTSVRELLGLLSELTEHKIETTTVPEFVRKNEVWRLLGSTTKLDVLLPDRLPLIPLRDVLAEMLAEAGFVR